MTENAATWHSTLTL